MMKRITLSHLLVFFLIASAVDAMFDHKHSHPKFSQILKWDPSFTPVIVALACPILFVVFFSIYLRYCSTGDQAADTNFPSSSRLGIDPKLLDTFPILVYSSIQHLRLDSEALQCAVCLSEFDQNDSLRLLPTCNHVFHPQCIDAWLGSHVTCPICRTRLTPAHYGGGKGGDAVIVIQDEENELQELDESSASRRTESNSGERSLGRCHSTGHSLNLVETVGKGMERYTLRLSEDVRKQVLANHGGMRRTMSYDVFVPGPPGDEVKCQKF